VSRHQSEGQDAESMSVPFDDATMPSFLRMQMLSTARDAVAMGHERMEVMSVLKRAPCADVKWLLDVLTDTGGE